MVFFSKALAAAGPMESILELGANLGQNLRGLRHLFPDATLTGVEINKNAHKLLSEVPGVTAVNESILEYSPNEQHDLVFTKTVLIHIAPQYLPKVYDLMVAGSRRYILVAEYFSPMPVTIAYRGHVNRLFKRDFAGDLLDRHPELSLLDYGFAYRRDKHVQDDLNWFLLEKRGG